MKKIKLFFVFSLILFPFLTVTAQTQTIDENNQDDLSILLSNLSFREIENIAKKIADAYLTKQSITEFNHNLTWEDANSIQEKLINILSSSQGELIGYKAALTNKKAQETFKVKEPLLGILLENMLLPSGITIPANFGAKPMIEGDLMVRVASEKINEVTTPQDTLKYLDAVIPFLELPDLVYDKNIKVNAEMLIAINAGARLGVVGEVITIDRENINKDTLKDISVKLIDESGEIIAQGNSNALLGDPLNVVFWIKEQLKAQRKTLKKGDLLSLGSITPLIPVEIGKTINAQYTGLEKDQVIEVFITFE
ncbi:MULTISPECIES: 2-keto-4-pentenoate hydratase [Crocosphaera]|uniref:2-oxo-hepta-3-ene-1,7-dioic acid hydratase n=2 Tax=Crocosphaera watsonii TaxID=263511 RepID=T2J9X8_CROWT|nr:MULTISPECIES: 2-oxo-hepta-3-ene-1,7-dioic acid hydratase [Crocosphaera]NQZ60662.1 hydratase [Crocosphaera sp.]CCQ62673.1 2-oxo-hepta-3-ene-1,7-dioic acid hydratase [Crocosphaera watsonii WH 0401]